MIKDSENTAIFVPLVGQFDNIGDVILRRQMAARLAGAGQVHVLVGSAPDSFVDALQLPRTSVVYRSVGRWYRDALTMTGRRSAYFFKPGEIRLAISGLREHVGVLPLIAAVRARGGGIGCIGVGARGTSRTSAVLASPAFKLAHAVSWRDVETQRTFGFGSTAPDLAFSEGRDLSADTKPHEDGKYLVASFRSDRAALSDQQVAGLRQFAKRHDCQIVIAPQVGRDGSAAESLAKRLSGAYWAWTSQSHLQREVELRELYRSAKLVVSNRLHVLVAAVTEGAAIAGLGQDVGGKVERHFLSAGISNATMAGCVTDAAMAGFLEASVEAIGPRRLAVLEARRQIDEAFIAVGHATGLSFAREKVES